MSTHSPRCPNGTLASLTCVTQKCNASPFICSSPLNCACANAHQYCKTMKWTSVVDLILNYRQGLPGCYRVFVERVEKVYRKVIQKLENQLKIFYQYIEQKLYGPEYNKILHSLTKQNYNTLTCNILGTVLTKMTSRLVQKKLTQEGVPSAEKFTLNQMKKLDTEMLGLMASIERLYREKFRVVDKEFWELQGNVRGRLGNGVESWIGHERSSSGNLAASRKINSGAERHRFGDIPMTQSLVFKRSDSNTNTAANNFIATTASNFHKTSASKPDFTSTKDTTTFFNPESPLKQDLTYPKHINSKILSSASILNHFLQAKIKQYRLIYRASENGFQIGEFYGKIQRHSFEGERERGKGQGHGEGSMTLLLARTEFGRVIGGFTRLKWTRPTVKYDDEQSDQQGNNCKSQHYKEDIRSTSSIFSPDLSQLYSLQSPKHALYCSRNSIGFGKSDIRIVNHCSKHSKNYIGFPDSYNNNNAMYLATKKSSLALSGGRDSRRFRVLEWEVFQVVFNQKDRRLHWSESGKGKGKGKQSK